MITIRRGFLSFSERSLLLALPNVLSLSIWHTSMLHHDDAVADGALLEHGHDHETRFAGKSFVLAGIPSEGLLRRERQCLQP